MSEGVVVAVALGIEARALRRGAPGLRVVQTGLGKRRACRAATTLARDPARRLAIAGVCGALDPELEPGDVVVASRLIAPGGEEHETDTAALVAALQGLGLEARIGALVSQDHVVRGDERARLRSGGAVAVDMESAWLAQGAGSRPVAALRVVVDGPGRELVRPGILRDGWCALRTLRQAAPALAQWGLAH